VPAADFAAHLGGLVTGASGALKAAETASAQQVAGKGDLIDVVTAIGAAETALDTMVAVRDRVIGAYSEIMRMQI
jgi:flagellar hook-basal body complex protein FliE